MSTSHEVHLTPVQELSGDDLKIRGWELHRAVTKSEVTAHLNNMNLIGVVLRHSASAERSAHLLRLQANQAQPGVRQSFVISATDGPESYDTFIGMASIDAELELRRQLVSIPPRIARRLPGMSRVVEVSERTANASLWLNLTRPEYLEETKQAAHLLGELATGGVFWNIVPTEFASTDPAYDTAMTGAGFSHFMDGQYLEDNEDTHSWVKPSTLYVHNQ
jgi:hypothetical protein